MGFQKSIISDRSSQFTSEFWKHMYKLVKNLRMNKYILLHFSNNKYKINPVKLLWLSNE